MVPFQGMRVSTGKTGMMDEILRFSNSPGAEELQNGLNQKNI